VDHQAAATVRRDTTSHDTTCHDTTSRGTASHDTTSHGTASLDGPGRLDDRAAQALAYFENRLRFATDASDVHAAIESGRPGFVLVDTRSQAAWDQGHLPGALHLPTARIAAEAPRLIPHGTPVVTYCWGPGCNGATKAAAQFARLGYEVREMLGGYEYWVREGFAVQTRSGTVTRAADPLTAPVSGPACEC
jgi:rhodanese-related sulfurtransferase